MTANPFFLPSLNCLQVSGEKAGQLLHGQFTNNIRDLTPGNGNYNLFLTVKGKVLADLHILRRENDFLLLIPQNFYALIAEHLQKLAPLSRVLLQDVSSQWQVLHVLGTLDQAEHPNTLVFRTDRLGDEGSVTSTPTLGTPFLIRRISTSSGVSLLAPAFVRVSDKFASIGEMTS